MLHHLKLLLPALVPSWRFFDWIAPSPRIEIRLYERPDAAGGDWKEFRPRPERLTMGRMLGRLFWNPRWNETLFLVSCAERLMQNPAEHSSREIMMRIVLDLERSADAHGFPYVQFRLMFLVRQGSEIERHEAFVSGITRYHKGGGHEP
ncbi:hypothetical protein GC177_06110 [bacterium]|nr:hypothetical protein [bacterium]